VGELRGVEAKLDVGSIWAERLWRRGSTAGLRLAGVRWSGGGVPGRGVEELAKARREKKEGVLLVLMRARGEGLGHCIGLATADCGGGRRWPHWARGARWRLQLKAKEGGEGAARRVEATRQAGGGAGAALHGGRAAHGTGGDEVEPWQPREARRGRVASGGGTSTRGMGPEACGGAT
jgi:hypothetical protein